MPIIFHKSAYKALKIARINFKTQALTATKNLAGKKHGREMCVNFPEPKISDPLVKFILNANKQGGRYVNRLWKSELRTAARNKKVCKVFDIYISSSYNAFTFSSNQI